MKRNWLKIIAIAAAALLVATPAMSADVTSVVRWMTNNSTCDQAGSFRITFTQADFLNIKNELAPIGTADFVRLKVSLSGTDVALDADIPVLCQDIQGTATAYNSASAVLNAVPQNGELVDLQTLDVEVSDVTNNTGAPAADGTQDVHAFAWGQEGSQFFFLYITDMQDTNWPDQNSRPWIDLGNYQKLIDAGDNQTTEICADVHDYAGIAKLLAVFDIDGDIFTVGTGSTQIGQFVASEVEVRDCGKDDFACDDDDTFPLCPYLDQASCPDLSLCFVAEGDYPSTGNVEIVIRTNGAEDDDTTQAGVYLQSVTLRGQDDSVLAPISATYYQADGSTAATVGDCDFEAQQVVILVDSGAIWGAGTGGVVQFCITYEVDVEEAEADTDARFWVVANKIPCGALVDEVITGARLTECGGTPTCMYFPYVLTNFSPWSVGIAITNLSSQTVSAEDMVVTFTLTDADGVQYTAVKDDFTTVMWSANVSSEVSIPWPNPLPSGPALLEMECNFTCDGYSFLTDGTFGAGTLARLQTTCGAYGLK